jgi:hypothetical protein
VLDAEVDIRRVRLSAIEPSPLQHRLMSQVARQTTRGHGGKTATSAMLANGQILTRSVPPVGTRGDQPRRAIVLFKEGSQSGALANFDNA